MPNWCYAFILGICVIILMLMLQPSGGIIQAVGEDFDGDGFTDLAESGQPLCNGVNQDPWDVDGNTILDTVIDDGCGSTPQFGAFSEAAFNIGTAADRRCGDYVGAQSGAWPSDLSNAGASLDKINLLDTSSFTAPVNRLNKKPNQPEYDKRWDLAPGPPAPTGAWITVQDMAWVTNAYPPMAPYYGAKSFGHAMPCIRHEYQPTLPAQGAFFYPWFPGTWAKSSIGRPCTDQVAPHNCYTVYDPTLGFYDSQNTAIIDQQYALMKKAHLDFGIMSWFPNNDFAAHAIMERGTLPASPHLSMRWALYYEPEGTSNPAVGDVNTPGTLIYDISHLFNYDMSLENYLWTGDPATSKPIIFVYGGSETCEMADRWKAVKDWLLADAETELYVVLKVFPGYASCANQPDGWHQYGPDTPVHNFAPSSTTISPGYVQIDNPNGCSPVCYLARDPVRFETDANAMVTAGNTFQLVTSWNEWGEGHAVEPANEFGEDYVGAMCRAFPGTVWMPTCPTAPSVQGYLIGSGDIAECPPENGDELSGDVIEAQLSSWIPITMGDNAYESGTAQQFTDCYEPAWGAFKARTKAVAGNHDWLTANAQGYKDYFGPYIPVDPGYYAYDVGNWRVYALDSDCSQVGGCANGNPQYEFVEADLAANPRACVLAYWHHPVYTAGPHADNEPGALINIWQLLYDNGADVVLSGHDHSLQIFSRLNRDGNGVDPLGMREFIIGTGGKGNTDQTRVPAGLEASADVNHTTYGNQSHNINPDGVIKMTLRSGGYDWQYMPAAGKSFVAAGREVCR